MAGRSLVAAQGPRAFWNTLGGQPIAGERRTLDQAIEATRRQVELLEAACVEIGSLLEVGVPEFMVVYPSGDASAEAILERFALDSMPKLRPTTIGWPGFGRTPVPPRDEPIDIG